MEFLDVVNNWDEKSLQALYDNYYKALVGFSYTIVGSVEMAEDVVQDVLVNVWQKKVVCTSEGSYKVISLYVSSQFQCIFSFPKSKQHVFHVAG